MPTNRFHHLIVAGLVVTVSVFLVLAAQAGLSAAASDTSDASTSGALQGKVRIHLRGYMKGPQFAAFGRGRFTMSGAISDRGRFVDEFQGVHPPNEPHVRTLRGAKGTIQMMVDGGIGCRLNCGRPRWRITNGTKAYAGLWGRGTQEGQYRFVGIDATMTGTVGR
jgi:hypothetical protein